MVQEVLAVSETEEWQHYKFDQTPVQSSRAIVEPVRDVVGQQGGGTSSRRGYAGTVCDA